ncbi:MAG TPA: hypothetical protein VHM19_19890 [Polyangiales bacterium]|nr:hypothetical protein [Polyangiales bacterium]
MADEGGVSGAFTDSKEQHALFKRDQRHVRRESARRRALMLGGVLLVIGTGIGLALLASRSQSA